MARIDLDRAEALLRTARRCLDRGDLAGVAGLAYQAFESAVSHLLEEVNGHDRTTHHGRRMRAMELIGGTRDEMQFTFTARNIDFYGNVVSGGPKRELTEDEARRALGIAEGFIAKMKDLLQQNE